MIFLPGTDQQVKFFLESGEVGERKILIIGPGTLGAAKILKELNPEEIIIVVNDYDSLINMRYEKEKSTENIMVKMMDYDNTDFKAGTFDIVYAQGSVSGEDRNKIIKEIRKILKPDGIFCAGEIVSLKENPPAFIKDIWQSSDLLPLLNDNAEKYYENKGFEIINRKDLSYTLKDFYRQAEKLSTKSNNELNEHEKSHYKKILKKLSHETNVYLKLGGDEYIGFKVFIMRKK
ncbi:MAG TPA: class I SAM-dependent methyltransferase [Ignavibacteriaceae bacterium]|nr:class I SAM-dependent methyltransferase [Ignavibacteriaceae bacterium]